MESMINFVHSTQRRFWNLRSSQQLHTVGATQTLNERQNFHISGVAYFKLEVLCVKKPEVPSKLKTYFNKHLAFQLKKSTFHYLKVPQNVKLKYIIGIIYIGKNYVWMATFTLANVWFNAKKQPVNKIVILSHKV